MREDDDTGCEVEIDAGERLVGNLCGAGRQARGLVIFAHGSGSSRRSVRNRHVARHLRAGGLATLLIDLLTAEEERQDARTAHLRFDIGFLAQRLVRVTDAVIGREDTRKLRVGYFGASTGGGAALVAASIRPDLVCAVVSRGGRPDLAGPALAEVRSPTLLIVGGEDSAVVGMNEDAYGALSCEKHLEIVPGATHLFQEPGALDKVAELARGWLLAHLAPTRPAARGRPSPRGGSRTGDACG